MSNSLISNVENKFKSIDNNLIDDMIKIHNNKVKKRKFSKIEKDYKLTNDSDIYLQSKKKKIEHRTSSHRRSKHINKKLSNNQVKKEIQNSQINLNSFENKIKNSVSVKKQKNNQNKNLGRPNRYNENFNNCNTTLWNNNFTKKNHVSNENIISKKSKSKDSSNVKRSISASSSITYCPRIHSHQIIKKVKRFYINNSGKILKI